MFVFVYDQVAVSMSQLVRKIRMPRFLEVWQ